MKRIELEELALHAIVLFQEEILLGLQHFQLLLSSCCGILTPIILSVSMFCSINVFHRVTEVENQVGQLGHSKGYFVVEEWLESAVLDVFHVQIGR